MALPQELVSSSNTEKSINSQFNVNIKVNEQIVFTVWNFAVHPTLRRELLMVMEIP